MARDTGPTDTELLYTLGMHFKGETLEEFQDLLHDGDADMEPGDLFRISKALQFVGKALEQKAKDSVSPRIYGGRDPANKYNSGDVQFQWVPETQYPSLDTDAVKRMFPREEYPELYRLTHKQSYIKAS